MIEVIVTIFGRAHHQDDPLRRTIGADLHGDKIMKCLDTSDLQTTIERWISMGRTIEMVGKGNCLM